MPRFEIDLNPVTHITADAIGQPGKRVFYIQGWKEEQPQPVTILVEKIQLQSLVVGVEQLLAEISNQHPDLKEAKGELRNEKMHISPPVDPIFRAGDIGLGYDAELDLVILLVREIMTENANPEDAAIVRFWCTRTLVRHLALWGNEVIGHGRLICPQCGQPMETEGHFCPKKNGHKKQ